MILSVFTFNVIAHAKNHFLNNNVDKIDYNKYHLYIISVKYIFYVLAFT